MRLARFPSSPRFACTLAFLAICLALGFGAKAAGSGAAKLPMTHGTARVQSPRAEVPTDATRPHGVHMSLPSPKSLMAPSDSGPRTPARIIEASDSRPLVFEPNQGQTDELVKFLSRGRGHTLFLTGDEAVLALRSRQSSLPASLVLRMKLVGADPKALVSGLDALPSTSNYFIGNDPKKWRTHIPNYAQVQYKNVYPGVDLVYYGNERQLEYDFMVAPGADPRSIALAIVGGEAGRQSLSQPLVQIDRRGDLVVQTEGGKVHLRKPFVYQPSEQEGRPTFVDGSYVLSASRIQDPWSEFADREYEVRFEVAAYDHTKPLIIDPVLSYSTYLGGSQDDGGNGIAVDASGNAYVAGSTLSADFPTVTPTPLQGTCGGCDTGFTDAFVAKLDAAGSSLVYTTYLGGSSSDQAFAIATDSAGNVYVTGRTYSNNFPTVNPVQPAIGSLGIADVFIAKLNAAGSSLVYSTYLGGSSGEQGLGIAVDSDGNAYVVGSTLSKNFPPASPLQAACVSCTAGDTDAFVTKLNAAGSSLVFSTYLGGSGADEARGIAVDSTGAYVTGLTHSNNFPLVSPLQPAYGGVEDAFVLKMNSSGSALIYSTYLGGTSADEGHGIALDSSGNAYVTGWTTSSDFPTANAAQSAYRGGQDAFVAKLDSAGATLAYSTYLGGTGADQGSSIAVDSSGQAYVTGYTTSANFPLANPIQSTYGGNQDAFVSKLSATGVALVFSTYLGGHDVDTGTGIAVDSDANPYVTGLTFSNDFPTASPLQAATGGGYDAFVAKLAELAAPAVALSATSLVFPAQAVATTSTPQTITLTNAGDADLAITTIERTGDFAQTNTCGSAVAAGADCTIDVTFTPTVAGARTGAVTITDDAAGNPHVVQLGGTGGVAFSLSSPTSTSTVPRGTDSTTFSISAASQSGFTGSISLSCAGDAPANCAFNPASIAPGESSTLTVSNLNAVGASGLNFYAVGTSGSATASLPLTVLFPDFTILATPGTAAITAGQSATYTLSLTPLNSFNQAVTLTCSGAPTAGACKISPSSVTPNGTSTSTAIVTVTTAAPSIVGFRHGPSFIPPPLGNPVGLLWFAGLLVLITAASLWKAPRRARVALAMMMLLVLAWTACSVGGSEKPPYTPTGNYQLVVTATAPGGLQHSIAVGLTVK